MIVPRIGALCLLIGFGFAVAVLGQLMYTTAREGFSSWVPVAIMLAPTALLGLASALLVLRRHPLGARLAIPFCILLAATAMLTLVDGPPVGRFLDDYEAAALERGVDVPDYRAEAGTTEAELVREETRDVRLQGGAGALALVVLYLATVLRGSRTRPAAATTEPEQPAP